MRDMEPAMATALETPPYSPVLIARLDIDSDPVYAWTGQGFYMPTGTTDEALNGITFDEAKGFVDMSPLREEMGASGPVTITHAGHDIDEALLRQVVRDKRTWRGKDAYLWVGAYNSSLQVVTDPLRLKSGVITSMQVSRKKGEAIVSVVIDDDLQSVEGVPFLYKDHPRIWPTDTFGLFVSKLFNKPGGLERSDLRSIQPSQSQSNLGSILAQRLFG